MDQREPIPGWARLFLTFTVLPPTINHHRVQTQYLCDMYRICSELFG